MVKWSVEYQCMIQQMDAIVNTVVQNFFLSSVIAAGRIIVIDWEIDAPGNGKGVVYGMNAIDKGYIGKCLCLTSTPEVHNDEKRMNIYSMNKEDIFSFAEECQCFLPQTQNTWTPCYTVYSKMVKWSV